jgi:signal transduction histidine kinase
MTHFQDHTEPLAKVTAQLWSWSWLVLLALALWIADSSALLLSTYSANVGAIWLCNGVVVAAMMRAPTQMWAQMVAVAGAMLLAGELIMGNGPVDAVAFSAVNILEVLMVTVPLRMLRLDGAMSNPFGLMAFYAIAGVPATLISSLLAIAWLSLSQGVNSSHLFPIWYASAAAGMITIAPLGAVLRRRDFLDFVAWRKLPGTIGLCFVMVATMFLMRSMHQLPLGFLFFPVFLLFTAFRGYAGLAFCTVAGSLATFANLLASRGFLSVSEMQFEDKLIVLQLFVGVLSLTSMLFASVLSERRKLIEQLRDASTSAIASRDAAEYASRTKSSFLASMSHELRTPLNAILGYSEIMRDGLLKARCEGECREHSKIIHGAGSHLLSLINDILDMSKIEAGKFDLHLDRVDACAAVRDCVGLMDVRAQQGRLRVVAALPPGPQEMLADGRALRQIVLNLLSNAIKFTPAGGTVTVSLRQDCDRLVLSVRDTGIGIPAKDLPRLGVPFEQVRRSSDVAHSGTGLGLALVSALAQKHGGGMTIESEEGVGTVVTITLPREPAAAAGAQPLAAE